MVSYFEAAAAGQLANTNANTNANANADDPIASAGTLPPALQGELSNAFAASQADQIRAALAQYGVTGTDAPLAPPAWDSTNNGLDRASSTYSLDLATQLGYKPNTVDSKYADDMVDLEERMNAANLGPASKQYVRDRIGLALASGAKASDTFDKYGSDAALSNLADMDEASRAISAGIAQSRAPIDEAEAAFTRRQAAMQSAIAPRVSEIVARSGGENSPVGQLAAALQIQKNLDRPDFAAQRVAARDQILSDPTIQAYRANLAARTTGQADEINAAIDAYRNARFQYMSGGVTNLTGGNANQFGPARIPSRSPIPKLYVDNTPRMGPGTNPSNPLGGGVAPDMGSTTTTLPSFGPYAPPATMPYPFIPGVAQPGIPTTTRPG